MKLRTIPKAGGSAVVKRSTEDVVSEVLDIARAQADSMRAMQAQITHVEETLNRAPFGDNGMALSNLFATGHIPLSGYGSPLVFESRAITADGLVVGLQSESLKTKLVKLFLSGKQAKIMRNRMIHGHLPIQRL